jgi:hypothetical protein
MEPEGIMTQPELYRVTGVYWLPVPSMVAFWPVLQGPGRQRRTRLAFDNRQAAWWYGRAILERYKRLWMQSQEN